MTFMVYLRELARQDSMALRLFAQQGRTPRCAPFSAIKALDGYQERARLHNVRLMASTPAYQMPRRRAS